METNEMTQIETVSNFQSNGDFTNIVKSILTSGGVKLPINKIKNVNFEEIDNYVRLSFTLCNKVPAFVMQEDGSYKEGVHNVIFSSTFAIGGLFKEYEDYSWLAKHIVEKPQILNLILNGAEIRIVQQKISAGESYINPFTTKIDRIPTIFEHDTIINHIVEIKLGKTGMKMADKFADKLLGF